MLGLLGLDAWAEEVYRAMLSHRGKGVAELADVLGRPEQDIRSALDRLHELSLVRSSQEALHAVSPELGMEILLAQQQAELAAQQQRVEASRAAAAQLIAQFAEHSESAQQPNVEHLTGIEQIREKLGMLTHRVRGEVMTLAPNGAHTPESLRAARPLDTELLDRGVRMRTVYLDSVRNSRDTVAYAEWLAERGGQVRTVPSLPVRMVIVDRETAVIPVRADAACEAAVVLTGQGTLTALCALFDSIWACGVDLTKAQQRDESGLSAQEREVLNSLYRGMTDDSIAKRLGVSPRTARRVANDMMERLGARSRFQAGALAVQNGWLPSVVTP
ncbi:erythropoiesis-stimulating protein [Streptomyces yokosukanensis]|uniref:Erythropoiesis-stimulating protein n=1 Tax=Streptomyces yokosukanensis TaxID=67386 RepID=A0A101NWB8_9ACTN|nr:LuxR C-terminal-related transcriptional regulator [Streptomyces yokosukanensis]KUN00436.1 erythropoiesis-stimulating protein [Streptomyces yokosukanensis]